MVLSKPGPRKGKLLIKQHRPNALPAACTQPAYKEQIPHAAPRSEQPIKSTRTTKQEQTVVCNAAISSTKPCYLVKYFLCFRTVHHMLHASKRIHFRTSEAQLPLVLCTPELFRGSVDVCLPRVLALKFWHCCWWTRTRMKTL